MLDEIPIRIRREAYDVITNMHGKSIKDKIDDLIKCNKTHIVQTIVGRILTGNAGLTNKHKRNGYVIMLCTMDSKDRYVDLVLTKEQLCDFKKTIDAEVLLMEENK